MEQGLHIEPKIVKNNGSKKLKAKIKKINKSIFDIIQWT